MFPPAVIALLPVTFTPLVKVTSLAAMIVPSSATALPVVLLNVALPTLISRAAAGSLFWRTMFWALISSSFRLPTEPI